MTGFTNFFGKIPKKNQSPTDQPQLPLPQNGNQKNGTFSNLALVKVHISLVGLKSKETLGTLRWFKPPWPWDPQTLGGHDFHHPKKGRLRNCQAFFFVSYSTKKVVSLFLPRPLCPPFSVELENSCRKTCLKTPATRVQKDGAESSRVGIPGKESRGQRALKN